MVIVQGKPHVSLGRRSGRKLSRTAPGSGGSIRLVADMRNVPEHLIALIYVLKWLIELFLDVQASFRPPSSA
jgi:hypothetical protein